MSDYITDCTIDDLTQRLWGNGKFILGPMVRGSSLPLRLAAIEFGADTVYSEEILASRVDSDCERVENECIGTIDFIRRSRNEVIFRTHKRTEKESSKCVLQIGCSNAKSALKASRMFANDVAAIDINMGCPKSYSVDADMGSALISKPEKAEDIVKTLRRNLSVPISVKTRLVSISSSSAVDIASSVEWVERLQRAGACAVAVHLRTPHEKSSDAIHGELFSILAGTLGKTNTPFVVNGDLWCFEDIKRLQGTGVSSSYMLSRSALWNPSIFDTFNEKEGKPVPIYEVMKKIVHLSISTSNCLMNTKYLLQQILAGNRSLASPIRNNITQSKSMIDLSEVFGIQEFAEKEKRRQISSFPSSMTGSLEWPGLTRSCHFYEDKFFDLNYYHSFCKSKRKVEDAFNPILAVGKEEVANILGSVVVPKKKYFVYSPFI